MARETGRMQLKHPTRDQGSPRITTAKYDAVRAAILQVVPQDRQGMPFTELAAGVARALPPVVLATLGSVG